MSDPSLNANANTSKKPLGQYLVEAKLLTPAHIEVALYDQRERGYRLGDILAMRGWVKEELIEWIVQNKLLPERQAREGDLEAVLVSLKEVLERQEAEAKKRSDQTHPPESAHTAANSPHTPTPVPPPPPALKQAIIPDVAQRETLILPLDEEQI